MEDTYIIEGLDMKYDANERPPSERDEIEREKIFSQFEELFHILKKNPSSRRCVATFMTERDGSLSYACPSLIQVFTKNKKIYVRAYFRSLHLKKNFSYDKNTLKRLMVAACMFLEMKPGNIKIFIGCPHDA